MGTVGTFWRFVFLMDLSPFLFLLLGLLVGGGVVFLIFRIRGDAARQIEVSSLNERLSQREEQIGEQKAELQQSVAELRREQEQATNSERLHAVAVQQIKEADRRTGEQKALLKEAEKAFRSAIQHGGNHFIMRAWHVRSLQLLGQRAGAEQELAFYQKQFADVPVARKYVEKLKAGQDPMLGPDSPL